MNDNFYIAPECTNQIVYYTWLIISSPFSNRAAILLKNISNSKCGSNSNGVIINPVDDELTKKSKNGEVSAIDYIDSESKIL